MKSLVRLLLRRPLPGYLPACAGLGGLILFVLSLITLGAFSGVDYDDRQNSAFAEALHAQAPLRAVKAAVTDAGPAFAARLRTDLAKSANELRQSEDAAEAFDESRPKEEEARAWNDEYVCGLKGWGVHRPVLRKLVLSGYGDCGWLDRFYARAPALYRGAGFAGWMITLAPLLLFILLVLAAIVVALVRRAYVWLYESRMRG